MKLNSIILALLSLFAVSMATMLQCPSTIDYHATLAEFYQATGGPTHWTNKWDLTDPNFCNYYGINCASRYIDLPNNNLVGEIPDSFWCLDNFKAFNFTHNQQLTANVAKIETLRHIQFLDLSYTGFYGMLPTFEQSALNVSLKHLNLTYTCIEGPIPSTINKLSFLAALRLGKTALSGMVPLSLYDLPLKELMLECTNLDASVFNLPAFRAQKGLNIVAVPDIRGPECPINPIIPSWCPVTTGVMAAAASEEELAEECFLALETATSDQVACLINGAISAKTAAECTAASGTAYTDCEFFGVAPLSQCSLCISQYKPNQSNMYCYKQGLWVKITESEMNDCTAEGGRVIESCNDFNNCYYPPVPMYLNSCDKCGYETGAHSKNLCIKLAQRAGVFIPDIYYYVAGENGKCDSLFESKRACSDLFYSCTNNKHPDCNDILANALYLKTSSYKPNTVCIDSTTGAMSAPSTSGLCAYPLIELDATKTPNCKNDLPIPRPSCSESGCASCAGFPGDLYCTTNTFGTCLKFNSVTVSEYKANIAFCKSMYDGAHVSELKQAASGACMN